MRRGLPALGLSVFFFAGCMSIPKPQPAAAVKPAIPVVPPPVIPKQANFLIAVSETVALPEDDVASYTKVFIDNHPAGETQIGAKSQEKTWGAVLEPGNHLFRFETWNLPSAGDWAMLDKQWQPSERFIRIEPAQKTVVRLKFFDNGTKNTLDIDRTPFP